MEEVQENTRAPISAAMIKLAGACARRGSWENANDLLLDASEEAFAGDCELVDDSMSFKAPVAFNVPVTLDEPTLGELVYRALSATDQHIAAIKSGRQKSIWISGNRMETTRAALAEALSKA